MLIHSLSHLTGWVYVICFSISIYPTIISNIQLKSVQGISIDYMFFNFMGFILYSVYTGSMFLSPLVREEFHQKYGSFPLIKLNDLAFGLHGIFVNLFILSQTYVWGYKRNDNQKLSQLGSIILSSVMLYLFIGSAYIIINDGFIPKGSTFNWLELFTSLGLVKVVMSICKNIPQMLYNHNRKSTHGWPILMIWLDFVGGLLSLVQLALDAYESRHLGAMVENLPKFLLSIEVVLADFIFFFQHYYLYYESDVQKYGPFKTGGYGSIEEDEEFVVEHQHDHDHALNVECNVSPGDKSELQRLIS